MIRLNKYGFIDRLKIRYNLFFLYLKTSGNVEINNWNKRTFNEFYSMYYWIKRGSLMEEYLWQMMEEKAVDFESMESMLILSIYQLQSLCHSGCCHSQGETAKLQDRFRKTKDNLVNKLLSQDHSFGEWQSLSHSLYLACDKRDQEDGKLQGVVLQKCADKASANFDWTLVLSLAIVQKQSEIADLASMKIFGVKVPQTNKT